MQAWISSGTSERVGGGANGATLASRTLTRGPTPGLKPGPMRGAWLGRAVGAGCALPLVLLGVRLLRGEAGADPLHTVVHATGFWALTLLLATLAVTPLRRASVWVAQRVAVRFGRRVSDWNFIVRHRRTLGLWSFFYAALHALLHAGLDAGSWAELWRDATERPFVLLGLGAFALLVPLALTSTQASIRRLKRRWAHLHLLVYPAAGLALAHAWMQTKVGHDLPWGFVGVAGALLGARLLAWRAGDRRRAAEWPERGRSGEPD